MKQWKQPEIKNLAVKDTEYFALTGTYQDGEYISDDGKYYTPTYSGEYEKDIPFQAK